MGKQIDDLFLLAILQNQIKNAVDENKVDTSKFTTYKTVSNVTALTEDEKKDISENVYKFLFDTSSNRIYMLVSNSLDKWEYSSASKHTIFNVTNDDFKRIDLRENWEVICDINGNVTYTEVEEYAGKIAASVILSPKKYPNTTFYSNYFDLDPDPIYHFSSGIILDSSTETPQYKIVFASYNVNAGKVTFVEKVLT